MDTTGNHPLAIMVRTLVQTVEAEMRRSLLRLIATVIAMIICMMVVITAAMTAVAVGVIHLGRGLFTLAEKLIEPSWGADLAVGALLLLIPFLVAAYALRRSKDVGNDIV